MNEKRPLNSVKDSKRVRTQYSKPRLSEYGNVSALTQGTTSTTNDPGGSQNGKF